MIERWRFTLQSLSAQMILSSIALVLLMAAAVGLPAVWLIRGQFDRQAWAQIDQGSRATQALYEARQNELESLATLTAQRPTLQNLLSQESRDALYAYLDTLREGSGLDLIAVCTVDQALLAQSGTPPPGSLCGDGMRSGFYVAPRATGTTVWLLAVHPITGDGTRESGTVAVGLALDDEFTATMQAQTGLAHTLLASGQMAATSLPERSSPLAPAPATDRITFSLNGRSYYASRLPLDAAGLEAEVALEVTEGLAAQHRLVWGLAGGILAVAAIASLLGTYLARRIGQPLASLALAADTLSNGELSTPLQVQARVREVALVAQALEGARTDLERTLAQLRQEKAWTDHLLEAIVEGIVTLDRQGHITFFSHGAERITGWHHDQVLGLSCDQVFRTLGTDEPFSHLIPPPGQRRKVPVELQDGQQAILAITGARLLPPEGIDARVALVFRDISEEEAVHRLLGHFLANVSHEFRTPLSALAASVELLLDQAPDLSRSELEELLTSLHLGVLGLQTLTDNLLEGASIETGHFRVHPRPSHLAQIFGEAIGTMQPLLDKHGQSLVIELPADMPVVQADPRRTVQVLINLLSNACKYGPDDAEIEIGATVQRGWARVTVSDTGPGIPAEYRPDLFRRFVHPGLSSKKAQVGVGLGLSVVKAIVEAHDGKIGVEDRPGGGSTFWFTLPVVDEQ